MFPRLCTGGGNGYVGRWSVSSRVGRRKDRPSYVSSLNRHRGKGQQKVTVEPVHVRRHSGHAANPAARRAPCTRAIALRVLLVAWSTVQLAVQSAV